MPHYDTKRSTSAVNAYRDLESYLRAAGWGNELQTFRTGTVPEGFLIFNNGMQVSELSVIDTRRVLDVLTEQESYIRIPAKDSLHQSFMVGAAREGRHFLMLATEVGAEFDRFQEATYIETLEHIRNYFEVPIEKHEQVYDSFFDINRYDALWEQMDESVKFCKNMPMFSNLSKTQKEQVLLSVSSVVANVLDTKLPMREQMDVSRLEEDMQLFRTKLLAMNMSAPKTHFAMELYSRMSEMVQEVRISADVEHNRSYDEEVILMMANTQSEIRDAERQRIRFTDIHQFDGNSQVLKEQVVAVGKGKMLKEYFDLLQYRGLDDVKSELLAADKRLHVTLGKYQITDPILGELFQSCVKDTFEETMKATSYQLDGNHFGKKIIQHLQEKRIRQNCQETGTFERNVRRVAGHSREAL